MSKTSPTDPSVVIPPKVTPAALALWAQSEARKVATDLVGVRVPVLMLKGPDLQMRLYGTPAAYASSDVDVLVPKGHAERARARLLRKGWTFSPDNGVLWRLSRAAAFDRDGFRLDLHWGLHAAHLPAWSLRKLERRLWAGATRGPSGMLEPDAESLLVFLAVHVVGHGFERPPWIENVRRAADLVADWDRVWAIAREARVEGAVRRSLSGREPDTRVPLLDGVWGSFISHASWIVRGHFLPPSVRGRIRGAAALAREGFGVIGYRRKVRIAGDLELLVPAGVFQPWRITEELAGLGVEVIQGIPHPVVVDVGTGAGGVALLIARARPDADVRATDLSSRAVAAAKTNARRLGLENVGVHVGDLLRPLPRRLRGRVDAIVTNVPADPPSARLPAGGHDPRHALVGQDPDGLGLLRELAAQAGPFLRPGGKLVVMVLEWQWEALETELRSIGYRPAATRASGVVAHLFGVVERL
jgi:methylase of polypeptide subunit release factors